MAKMFKLPKTRWTACPQWIRLSKIKCICVTPFGEHLYADGHQADLLILFEGSETPTTVSFGSVAQASRLMQDILRIIEASKE